MKYPVVYVWALLVCVSATNDCTIIGGYEAPSYRREVVAYIEASRLTINWKTNKLYFTYYSEDMLTAVLDLDTNTYTDIEELSGQCSFAVNQRRGEVYAGCWNDTGRGGLYKYNSNIDRFVVIGERGNTIFFVSYGNDVLYYSVRESYDNLFTYANGRIRKVPQFSGISVTDVVEDRAGDWVFSTTSLYLFHMIRATGVVTPYANEKNLLMTALTTSPRGDVYTCDYRNRTIERLDVDGTLHQVAADIVCFGLVIDTSDHFICADATEQKIIRLIKC